MMKSFTNLSYLGAATLLLLASACGPSSNMSTPDGGSAMDSGIATTPAVLSNTPLRGATGVPVNGNASATFSEAMDRATLTPATFTLTAEQPQVPVQGTVIYAGEKAVFWPSAQLASNRLFTATITAGARSARGAALPASHVWSFTTGSTKAPGTPVSLGAAGSFVMLAKSRISNVPTSAVTGDMGISPAAASYITGFSLAADATNVHATSPQVSGKVYAADYAQPTPARMTTAVSDMELAFTDGAGRAPDFTELGAGSIGGMTLVPGVYRWSSGLLIPANVTLTGRAADVWIFQVAQDLSMSSAAKIILTGGARPENVFWLVSGAVNLGTTAHCEGVVLTQTSATLRTGASIQGRLLAQTAITLDTSTVTQPGP